VLWQLFVSGGEAKHAGRRAEKSRQNKRGKAARPARGTSAAFTLQSPAYRFRDSEDCYILLLLFYLSFQSTDFSTSLNRLS